MSDMQTHFHWSTEREKRILAERNPHWPKRETEIVIIIVVDFSLSLSVVFQLHLVSIHLYESKEKLP